VLSSSPLFSLEFRDDSFEQIGASLPRVCVDPRLIFV